jgi:UDP-N-acetylmuramoyl-tripeptide--D-alanyl-D-alanine ligase
VEFTLSEIIEAVNAKILKNTCGKNTKFTFSTDTRTIKKGEIYLPLKGENFDGENFIDKAIKNGAVGYFTSEKTKGKKEKGADLILQVEDTLTAYLELARFCRRKIAPKTVAITGSSGKTTTKEMAFCVASEKFKTHKSELNFNNEIGLCKTILAMPEDTDVLILEMGMRGLGEIELLSKYSEPDIAIIANVGTAHIGRLGSRENIAKAKCEIVKYLKDDGILITHNDKIIEQVIKPLNLSTVQPFNLSTTKFLERKIGYTKFNYKNHKYELNIEGDYNVQNSLAAIEMGLKLGMSEKEIATGLKKYSPIEKRWEIQEVNGYKIINDSYNANPESMKAMLKTVFDIYPPPLLLVLGDMGELGEDEIKYHQEIGEFLSKNIKKGFNVITVGKLANKITQKLNEKKGGSSNLKNNLQTSRYILDNIKIGTTIVLKASRAMKFEEIINEVKSKKQKARG